ncbi:hypothetical protein LTR27_002723 [Elasticomyces elasticus]|nr:hypothetical protein LTR27_002723 [Elasticomyces elasticus]
MASELAVEKGKASVEHYEVAANDGRPAVMGTMHLNTEELLLVPAPSSDPREKCRSVVDARLIGGQFRPLGSPWSPVWEAYWGFTYPYMLHKIGGLPPAEGATYADITALMTYPTMMMGVGNLICMPLALAVGRRFIYLMSLVTMILGGLLAAYSQSYGWHLGARMVLGIAAGNSEALVPMMIQEIHFIHERSTYLMWQAAMQLSITAVYCLFASPIAGAIGPGNWYILGVGLGAGVLLLSIVWVPETRYTRALAAYGQEVESVTPEEGKPKEEPKPMRVSERPALDFVTYPARTLRSDLRLFVGKPDWSEGLYALRNTFQVLLFPNVFWAFCLNGLTLGVNIALGTTYGTVLSSPPYNWSQNSVSYINAGQIVVSVIALPLLGNGSDWLIRWRARRNDGVHEPEVRLIPLVLPIILGVASAVLYGQAAAHPERFHWFAIVFAYAGYLFAFLGANIVGITLLLDSYPARAGPVLFGTSYGVAKFIETAGYDGAFGVYAGLTGLLGLIGIPM